MLMKNIKCVALLSLFIFAAGNVAAGEISFSGTITQSTADGTGPAANNTGLNAILDGDGYNVTLDFSGDITGTGSYDLIGATLVFSDAGASATESSFDAANLTIATDAADSTLDDVSLLGCLTTGSGCLFGNELAVDFLIPAAELNSQNVTASTIAGLSPELNLLEDDGVTDIQGSVTGYSYVSSPVPTPEPPSALLGIIGIIALGYMSLQRWGWDRA
jgi:hypothetical protein